MEIARAACPHELVSIETFTLHCLKVFVAFMCLGFPHAAKGGFS